MPETPTVGPDGNIYHMYLTPEENHEDREWILEASGNSQVTSRGDFKKVRKKANEVMSKDGSGAVLFYWTYSKKHGWYIKHMYLNRRYRHRMGGNTIAARSGMVEQ